jgi:hypothetical protein
MDCWHLDTVTEWIGADGKRCAKDEGAPVEQKVAWFTRHLDAISEVPYLAGIRCLPEVYPELLKAFPEGYVRLGFKSGLDRFYKKLEEINKGVGGNG